MRKFIQGIKGDLQQSVEHYNPVGQDPAISTRAGRDSGTRPPRREDWLKYRKHRGVNLGTSTSHPFERASDRCNLLFILLSRLLVYSRTLDNRYSFPSSCTSRCQRPRHRERHKCEADLGEALGHLDHAKGLELDCEHWDQFGQDTRTHKPSAHLSVS